MIESAKRLPVKTILAKNKRVKPPVQKLKMNEVKIERGKRPPLSYATK